MRVLFSSIGATGHVNPMVPLARALQARGNEVRWAVGLDGCDRVTEAGIEAVPTGRAQPNLWMEFWRRHPEARELPAQELPELMFPKVFGAIRTPAALADLMPLVRDWRPAVVVSDMAEFAARIAAAAIGVPCVTHSFGALLPETRVRAAGEEVAPLWREQGLEPRPYGGSYDHLYVDIYPPSLQMPIGEHVGSRQCLCPVPAGGTTGDGVATDLLARIGKPLVYLTFGTVFNENEAFRSALAGIAGLGVGLVVTVGQNGDPSAFGPQPAHVVVERYVPQMELLPSCDAVASHAGSGTVLATLALGIPQLCLPQGADQFVNAAAVNRAGAGIVLPPEEVTSARAADAVGRLLEDPEFGRRARVVAEEIASMPSPDEVAAVVEDLV